MLGNFNPHHRKGGDTIDNTKRVDTVISIHTTVKVVTRYGPKAVHKCRISIHTTVKVVTLILEKWLTQ